MFFNQKNKWNWGVKSNFENFDFWIVPISRFALAMTTINQFQILRLKLHMVFTQKFEFWFQNFFYFTFEKLNFLTFWGPSLPFCKIKGNHSDSMFLYLKNYLFLMGDFGFAIPWITLLYTHYVCNFYRFLATHPT